MKYPAQSKNRCEYLRIQAKQRYDQVRSTHIELGSWAAPNRIKWLLSQTPGERNNRHIVDPTHLVALRSFVAGFLEGNTSATRPWFRIGTSNQDISNYGENRDWLDKYARRCLQVLSNSNFYNSAGQFYYDYGTFNVGAHYIEELKDGLYFHTLTPGGYYVINNGYGEAEILVREFSLNVQAVVDTYGKKDKNGNYDWSNFSSGVRKCYEDSNYTQQVDIVHIVQPNADFDPKLPVAASNRQWMSLTYEVGGCGEYQYSQDANEASFGSGSVDPTKSDEYLNISFSKRKPFIVGRSFSTNNFEYGETGPTLDALGLIKSLNKKAIGKDQALEQMLRPALQGPANLKKSYITSAANNFVPLDATSVAKGTGLRPIFEVNPAIAALVQDQSDLRQLVNKIYYADYLLYLSQNPKTRTATETNAIVQEQQLVIGPNLQSLNTTYNVPIIEFVMDYVLFEDPYLPPAPQALQGQFLRPVMVSVFAQAQNAADLPSVERYMAMLEQVGQIQNPNAMKIWDKVDVDKLADIYEDRLFLPAGLNRQQSDVDAERQQAQAEAQRQQMLQQTIPALAGAAKDAGLAQPPQSA